ncbi:hypothetical protein SUGI_0722490 [Cryptomeria japonica]|nr:hypothetical protein SUGI_0722490 [Cryptomeria japonica]
MSEKGGCGRVRVPAPDDSGDGDGNSESVWVVSGEEGGSLQTGVVDSWVSKYLCGGSLGLEACVVPAYGVVSRMDGVLVPPLFAWSFAFDGTGLTLEICGGVQGFSCS